MVIIRYTLYMKYIYGVSEVSFFSAHTHTAYSCSLEASDDCVREHTFVAIIISYKAHRTVLENMKNIQLAVPYENKCIYTRLA